jgi:hypothetical protein
VTDRAHLYEFVVPMVPPTWNDRGPVQRHAQLLQAGSLPAAVAVAVSTLTLQLLALVAIDASLAAEAGIRRLPRIRAQAPAGGPSPHLPSSARRRPRLRAPDPPFGRTCHLFRPSSEPGRAGSSGALRSWTPWMTASGPRTVVGGGRVVVPAFAYR